MNGNALGEPRAICTHFDIRSKLFKITLSISLLWLISASVLAWYIYDDKHLENLPSSLQARNWLCDDNPFIVRPQSQSEKQGCLKREAEREAHWRDAHERWAREGAIEWHVLRGLALPACLLVLAALRNMLTATAMRIWKSYWQWLNSDTTPSSKQIGD